MTIQELYRYIFFANIGMILVFSTVFNIALVRIKDKKERKYFTCLLFVMILVCGLTILSYYKIALNEYFLLIRGLLQPILVFITTYYLYSKYLKNETKNQENKN